jgi:hypothetical protein
MLNSVARQVPLLLVVVICGVFLVLVAVFVVLVGGGEAFGVLFFCRFGTTARLEATFFVGVSFVFCELVVSVFA